MTEALSSSGKASGPNSLNLLELNTADSEFLKKKQLRHHLFPGWVREEDSDRQKSID